MADAANSGPSTIPTEAADVDSESEAPELVDSDSEAGAETKAAEQEARAPAAEAVAEANVVDDSAPEDGMPGLHQE